MLSFLLIWLALQLPIGLALGRFIGCVQKAQVKRSQVRKISDVKAA
jgi:hypothetical protein